MVEQISLSDLLMRAARTLRRRWSQALTPWDLSPHQSRALRAITNGSDLRLSEVADALRIAPRSATEVVDGLEAKGLVERVPDARDRRAVCVRPTAEGQRLRAEVDAARDADANEFFATLPAADRKQLARLLSTLLDQ